MRTTKAELQSVFQHWLTANNFTEGHYVGAGCNPCVIPGYLLDYAAPYGGYRIEYLMESTGHRTPFGDTRHSARELVAMLRFQMDTLREKGN